MYSVLRPCLIVILEITLCILTYKMSKFLSTCISFQLIKGLWNNWTPYTHLCTRLDLLSYDVRHYYYYKNSFIFLKSVFILIYSHICSFHYFLFLEDHFLLAILTFPIVCICWVSNSVFVCQKMSFSFTLMDFFSTGYKILSCQLFFLPSIFLNF